MSEPIYITRDDDYSGPHGAVREDFIEKVLGTPAVRSCWLCPHCKMQFFRRKQCEKHMGMIEGLPAQCRRM